MNPSFRTRLGAVAVAACAFAASAAQAAPSYHLVDLGANYFALALNSHGTVAGTYNWNTAAIDRDGTWHQKPQATYAGPLNDRGDVLGGGRDPATGSYVALEWPAGGGVVSLPAPASYTNPGADGISADGNTIVGSASDAGGVSRCVRWQGGVPQDLGIEGTCYAIGVARDGRVGGSLTTVGLRATNSVFLWDEGVLTVLPSLGGPGGSYATGMNAKGDIVGNSQRRPHDGRAVYRAILWKNGHLKDLGTLDGADTSYSYAFAVNDHDDVVGYTETIDGDIHGFLYTGGQMLDLATLVDNADGWDLSSTHAISNDGTIVGVSNYAGGYHSYMLVPTSN